MAFGVSFFYLPLSAKENCPRQLDYFSLLIEKQVRIQYFTVV